MHPDRKQTPRTPTGIHPAMNMPAAALVPGFMPRFFAVGQLIMDMITPLAEPEDRNGDTIMPETYIAVTLPL